jgi:hypothetical protein
MRSSPLERKLSLVCHEFEYTSAAWMSTNLLSLLRDTVILLPRSQWHGIDLSVLVSLIWAQISYFLQ